MLRKMLNMYFCISALILGVGLYTVFRENTIISKEINDIIDLSFVRDIFRNCSNGVFKYYLPDFLWAFALCSSLNVVFDNQLHYIILSAVITSFVGVMWELLQLISVVSGTGDIIDVILYLSASIIAVTINIIIYRRAQ